MLTDEEFEKERFRIVMGGAVLAEDLILDAFQDTELEIGAARSEFNKGLYFESVKYIDRAIRQLQMARLSVNEKELRGE